jgi:hypothetical protein
MMDMQNGQVSPDTPPHGPIALGDYRLSLDEHGRLIIRTASEHEATVFFPGNFSRESVALRLESTGLQLRLRKP